MEPALEKILNLLLESERAGVAALDVLAGQVKSEELKQLLVTSREDENETVRALEQLISSNGGTPSDKTGPFAARVAAAGNSREQLNLLIRGEEWVTRKVEEALGLAPQSGPINQYLSNMARRHRFEVEWGRAELIRLINELAL